MSLIEPALGDAITPQDAWRQAAERVTPFGEYLGAKFGEGLLSTRPIQALEQALTPPPAGYPTDEMRVFGPSEQVDVGSPALTEEQFTASPYYRGQSWDDGMTEARAQALAGLIDRDTWRRSLIDRYQGGAGSVAGFVAEALPAFADPTNYVPILGAAAKAAMVGRLGVIAGSAAFHAAEAAANTALFEPAAVATALQRGQSVGLGDVAADIVLNAAAGSLFGLAGGFMERRALARAAGTRLRVDGLLRQADAVNAASDALAHEEPVDVAPFVTPEQAFRQRLLGGTAPVRPAAEGFDIAGLPPREAPPAAVSEFDLQPTGAGVTEEGHDWQMLNLVDHEGRSLAKIMVTDKGDRLYVDNIISTVSGDEPKDMRDTLGPRAMRYVLGELASDFPDARTIEGTRISGARRGGEHLPQLEGRVPPTSVDLERFRERVANRPEWRARVTEDGEVTVRHAAEPAAPTTGDRAFTAAGRAVGTRFDLVEAHDLVASHTDELAVNPAFPADLQPRDRGRAASKAQVAQIAANLNPELLGASATAGEGAPIVGPDGVVESGNGRVLALRKAYREGLPGSQRYRDWLERQGYGQAAAGMKEPVLVRRRTTDLSPEDRTAFTREANASGVAQMGTGERARADAAALSPGALELLQSGDVHAAGNRAFVRAFVDTLPESERGGMMTASGELSKAGAERVRNALLARAYGDPDLIARLAEEPESGLGGLGRALIEAAPTWAKLRDEVAAGHAAAEGDGTAALLEAVRSIAASRDAGQPPHFALVQGDLLGGGLSRDGRAFLAVMLTFDAEGNSRVAGAGEVGEFLTRYVEAARKQRPGADMFGAQPAGPAAIAEAVAPGRMAAAEAAFGTGGTGEARTGAGAEQYRRAVMAGRRAGAARRIADAAGGLVGDLRRTANPLTVARPEPPHPSVAEAAPRVGKPAPELETFAKDAGLEGYQQPLPGHEPKPEPGGKPATSPTEKATAAGVQRELGVGFNEASRIAAERNKAVAAATANLPPELQEIEAMKRGGDFLPEDEATLAAGEAEASRAESYATAYETLVGCVLRNLA
jgi:hypothetical protein